MIYFWKKYKAYPLWFICKKYKAYPLWFICEKIQGLPLVIYFGKNTRLTPCDLFLEKIQGLPLVIYILWKKIQGLPLVIYIWKKYKAYPLWFICKKNTRLTPCDFFVKKIQGLPLVIYFWEKYNAYPLWFICKKNTRLTPCDLYLEKYKALICNKKYPLLFIFGKIQGLRVVILFVKTYTPCDLFLGKYKADPLWFCLWQNTRLTPCDLYLAYPLWFIFGKNTRLTSCDFVGKKYKAYPLKSHGVSLVVFPPKKSQALYFFQKSQCLVIVFQKNHFYEYS